MFNDRLNVRTGNARRKQAMAKVAAKMMQNAGRSSGLGGLMQRAGGGLGKSNTARGMLGRPGMNPLARLAMGGDAQLGRGIGQFGIVERQPGAPDPGAVPDLGGISGLPSTGAGGDAPGVPAPSAPWQPGDPANFNPAGPTYFDPSAPVGSPGGQTTGDAVEGNNENVWDFGPGSNPAQFTQNGSGYVQYQGQWIPAGLYRALQQTGELF